MRAALAASKAVNDTADLAAVSGPWLVGSERERLARFVARAAGAEFLAGRMAAKAALAALAPDLSPDRCEIVPGVWHQPTLRPHSHGLAITLTHGGGLGLALAADDRWLCGIDVEQTMRVERDIILPMVTPDERRWADAAVDAGASRSRWSVLWTAREALGKMLRCGIARPGVLLPLVDISESDGIWTARFDRADIRAHATCFAGLTFSLVAPALDGGDPPLRSALTWLRERLGRGPVQ